MTKKTHYNESWVFIAELPGGGRATVSKYHQLWIFTSHLGPQYTYFTWNIKSTFISTLTSACAQWISSNYELSKSLIFFVLFECDRKDDNRFNLFTHKYVEKPTFPLSHSVTCVCVFCIVNPQDVSLVSTHTDTKWLQSFHHSVGTSEAF